jgi:hypothetical protein
MISSIISGTGPPSCSGNGSVPTYPLARAVLDEQRRPTDPRLDETRGQSARRAAGERYRCPVGVWRARASI